MPEIISRGNKHLKMRKARHKCSRCDSVIVYDKSDVQRQ